MKSLYFIQLTIFLSKATMIEQILNLQIEIIIHNFMIPQPCETLTRSIVHQKLIFND